MILSRQKIRHNFFYEFINNMTIEVYVLVTYPVIPSPSIENLALCDLQFVEYEYFMLLNVHLSLLS